MVQPSLVERQPMTVIGLRARYEGDPSTISELWDELGRRWEDIQAFAAVDGAYGVMTNMDDDPETFDYIVGVETSPELSEAEADGSEEIPADYVWIDVHGGRYVRFETSIATVEDDYEAVVGTWLPQSGLGKRPGPEYERYGPTYDAGSADSAYEYFLPVARIG